MNSSPFWDYISEALNKHPTTLRTLVGGRWCKARTRPEPVLHYAPTSLFLSVYFSSAKWLHLKSTFSRLLGLPHARISRYRYRIGIFSVWCVCIRDSPVNIATFYDDGPKRKGMRSLWSAPGTGRPAPRSVLCLGAAHTARVLHGDESCAACAFFDVSVLRSRWRAAREDERRAGGLLRAPAPTEHVFAVPRSGARGRGLV